jgi:hypothetical protein
MWSNNHSIFSNVTKNLMLTPRYSLCFSLVVTLLLMSKESEPLKIFRSKMEDLSTFLWDRVRK